MPMEADNCYSLANGLQKSLWFPPVSMDPLPMSFWCKRATTRGSLPSENRRKRPSFLLIGEREACDDHPLDLRCPGGGSRRTSESSYSDEPVTSPQLFVECGASTFSNSAPVATLSSCDSGLGTSTQAFSHSASPSPQPQKSNTFYPIQSPECLTAPYQSIPGPSRQLYVYTWALPDSDILADLSALHRDCFKHTDQCLAIIFSKPISENDYVCRVPLYLSQGMARARVHRAGSPVCLTQSELDRVVACHRVLAELLTNIADLSHVGLQFANLRLRSLVDRKNLGSSGSKTLAVRDPFEELNFMPNESRLLGLVTILSLPCYDLDFLAIDNLIHWSRSRESWKLKAAAVSTESVRPVRGIVRDYPVRLSQIPTEDWAGVMVRPSHLPHNDPAMFAVSGCSSKIGLDPVPTKLSEKLLTVLNPILPGSPQIDQRTANDSVDLDSCGRNGGGCGTVSYVDYFSIRYPSVHRMMGNFDGVLPLANCFRLTRHQNAAQVTAGLRKDKHAVDDKLAVYLADTCAVHPLSAWLWFLLSTFPLVVHQMSRALLISQFSAELNQILTRQESDSMDHVISEAFQPSPRYTVLMPDRLDAPRCMLSELNHFTAIDLEVQSRTPMEWSRLDNLAASNENTVASTRIVPYPNHLFEATTLLAARDAVNLERLELLGDSLLQLVATLNVYATAPSYANEGWLTAQRIPLVSNANLLRLALHFNWPKYCTGQVYSPPNHFVFPCYSVCKTAILPSSDARLTVGLTDKSLADMMEALIGCFLLHLGLSSAVRLLSHFGISPYGNNKSEERSDKNKDIWSRLLSVDNSIDSGTPLGSSPIKPDTCQLRTIPRSLCLPPNNKEPLSDSSDSLIFSSLESSFQNNQLKGLQSIIDYFFKDVTLLVQALTHVSSPHSKQFGTYERPLLESDGRTIQTMAKLGKLTDSRSNIVSNNSLASAVVEHKIHPYILHSNALLESAVICITCIQDRTTSYSEQLELINQEVLKGLRVKVLADVFESIIGAIFVDTHGNLNVVTRVIHRLLSRRIHDYLETTPTNPLRVMHLIHSDLKYTEISPLDSEETDGKYKLCAYVGGRQLCTYGTTRNEARLALARQLGVSTRSSPQLFMK
ncbi:Endoribonuclease Dicer 4 [Fasciola hepatica]|uniref:Endoribonuclease Dicer 4 n=1 Tax=Fasciola hepatica TaxID=6192 RepID=A0A4E0R7A4_FASHE|nr:Endoribonuclease Dicer 4 [Fasciola hepatica]